MSSDHLQIISKQGTRAPRTLREMGRSAVICCSLALSESHLALVLWVGLGRAVWCGVVQPENTWICSALLPC